MIAAMGYFAFWGLVKFYIKFPMVGVTWKRGIQIYQFSLWWLTPVMSNSRNDERKEVSSLFDRNRQVALQIITWSIVGVILASKIIDSVAVVLKDFINNSPTVLWNDLNYFTITGLELICTYGTAICWLSCNGGNVKKTQFVVVRTPWVCNTIIYCKKSSLFLFSDADLALMWLIHFN